jgi:hypothetical protein
MSGIVALSGPAVLSRCAPNLDEHGAEIRSWLAQ